MISIPKFPPLRFTFLRGLPAAAKTAFFVLFAARLADGVLMPFFALWAQVEGKVPIDRIGLLLGCYAGGELLATPFLGGIADRVGRRPTLLISTLGVGLGFWLLYLTRGAWASALALGLIGIFECALHPTAFTVIGDVTPTDEARARVASGAGAVVGPASGAWLVRWSLGLVFVAAALSLLMAALLVAVALPETRQAGSQSQEEDDDEEESVLALGAALRDFRLAALLVPVLLFEVAGNWTEAVVPLSATNLGTITPAGIGMLFTYAGVFSVCVQLPILYSSRRLAGSSLMLVSGGLLVLASGGLLVSPALPLAVGAVTLLVSAQMLVEPTTQALVNELAPVRARATYMAAINVVNDLKYAAGPAVGFALYALSTTLPWIVGLPMALIATLALFWAVHQREAGCRRR